MKEPLIIQRPENSMKMGIYKFPVEVNGRGFNSMREAATHYKDKAWAFLVYAKTATVIAALPIIDRFVTHIASSSFPNEIYAATAGIVGLVLTFNALNNSHIGKAVEKRDRTQFN